MQALGSPGYGPAFTLMSNRLGVDVAVLKAAAARVMPRLGPLGPGSATVVPSPLAPGPVVSASSAPVPRAQPGRRRDPLEIINAMESNLQQFQLGNVTKEEFLTRDDELTATLRSLKPHFFQTPRPSPIDLFGSGPWPNTYERRGAFHLFQEEANLSGWDVEPGWHSLPEEHKDAYRARAEAARRAAWVEFETILITPPPTRLENHLWSSARNVLLPPHTLTLIVTGFELFRDEQPEAGLEYQEVVRRREALTEKQRKVYDNEAWSRHRETCIALPRDYLANLLRERGEPVPWES